ncbi:hypothetical protein [Dactylosporangium salmoneum]|uniref:Acetyltransferase n=1 Tax=Dactylosporangium salmoneum TaxID=53361 RepID=A0ABN3FKP6_9ACTN
MAQSAQVELTVIEDETALQYTDNIVDLYAAVYAKPPYNEGSDDVRWFADSWPSRVRQPVFRLVMARADAELIGFTFGHQLPVDTRWWSGAQTPLPTEFTVDGLDPIRRTGSMC